MKKLACSALALAALSLASCTTGENDGRKYYSNSSPLQGKMGVTFKRVRADTPPATATASGATADGTVAANSAPPASPSDDPPGLLDRYAQPDEPGAEYWMHGQMSPNPLQSKMGVRVQRRKK